MTLTTPRPHAPWKRRCRVNLYDRAADNAPIRSGNLSDMAVFMGNWPGRSELNAFNLDVAKAALTVNGGALFKEFLAADDRR